MGIAASNSHARVSFQPADSLFKGTANLADRVTFLKYERVPTLIFLTGLNFGKLGDISGDAAFKAAQVQTKPCKAMSVEFLDVS